MRRDGKNYKKTGSSIEMEFFYSEPTPTVEPTFESGTFSSAGKDVTAFSNNSTF